jgi:hypothetical protein
MQIPGGAGHGSPTSVTIDCGTAHAPMPFPTETHVEGPSAEQVASLPGRQMRLHTPAGIIGDAPRQMKLAA